MAPCYAVARAGRCMNPLAAGVSKSACCCAAAGGGIMTALQGWGMPCQVTKIYFGIT